MKRDNSLDTALRPPLHELLLGALAALPSAGQAVAGTEAQWLADCAARVGDNPPQALRDWWRDPPAAAQRLLALSAQLEFSVIEVAALALAAAVETDTMTGRVIAWLQAPVAAARPTVGLLLRLADRFGLGPPGAALAQWCVTLPDAAERAALWHRHTDDVVLLFDEADALFGKRTDVKDSNDRFANARTNYWLQRIESFEGIAVLTSNSRSRFDSAFTRRLDAIIDFPLPTPTERRALWTAHLGERNALSAAELNCLATVRQLSGGHLRNVVLAAAAQADPPAQDAMIGFDVVVQAVAAEYRKLGRQVPAGLVRQAHSG